MSHRKPRFQTVMLAAALVIAAAVPAKQPDQHDHEHDHRQHAAHVHGVAQLNLVLEGTALHIEFASPAAGIVGFEHVPASDRDHAALDRAVATLKDGDRLFRFDSAAGCRMEDVKIDSSLLDDAHADHAHEHGSKGSRGDDSHADIVAAYHFECAAPARLEGLAVGLFEAFPATERLHLQFVIGRTQGGAELTAGNPVVTF